MNTYTDPEVVITAGGTRERIDDVRYIGNFSGGKLGYELARAYSELGQRVLLLAPPIVMERFGATEEFAHKPYASADDLEQALHSISTAKLVMHAAAVADYTPVRVAGKIASDKDELLIRMTRTPKIIASLRKHFGSEAKIIGFKLLSGVSEATLVDAAVQQITTNQTDLCIANDLQEISANRRVHIVAPTGEYDTLYGNSSELASQIAKVIGLPHA